MREPKSGDVYDVIKRFATKGTNESDLSPYEVGDTLELLEPTGQNPFTYNTPKDFWKVKCKHFQPPDNRSVWACIPEFISQGYIKLK